MKQKKRAWVIAADMGYGHQRAAFPFKDIAEERIINANSYKIISVEEKKTWRKAKIFYEFVSRLSEVPIIGKLGLIWINSVQKILPYYPLRSTSFPTYPVKYLHKKITKGFTKGLIEYLKTKDIPSIHTFYLTAMSANYEKLPNSYCVICDADINRVWAPLNTKSTRIEYMVPCTHAYNRLVMYGVPKSKIHLTGFPLPKECIGGVRSPITKKALARRIINLDPGKHFINTNKESLKKALGKEFKPNKKPLPLTITYVIGGAAAQADIPLKIMKSLKNKLILSEIKLCLVAGTHLDLKEEYKQAIQELGLKEAKDKGNITILCEMTKKEYFKKFSEQLNNTDILWTKPSELSFYCALGLPLILSPPIGAHEVYNRNWLHYIGAGIDQLPPEFCETWLEEGMANGLLARKAWNGFLNAPRLGTYNIEKIIFNGKK